MQNILLLEDGSLLVFAVGPAKLTQLRRTLRGYDENIDDTDLP